MRGKAKVSSWTEMVHGQHLKHRQSGKLYKHENIILKIIILLFATPLFISQPFLVAQGWKISFLVKATVCMLFSNIFLGEICSKTCLIL